jgi:hypothetical protein
MGVLVAAILVAVVQIATGAASGYVARKAKLESDDLLAEVTIGKGSVKFDKSDILAIALAVFIFWAVGNQTLSPESALAAFVAVLAGTGIKELIQALVPATA